MINKLRNLKDSELFPHYVGGLIGLVLSIFVGGLVTAEADEIVVEEVEDDESPKVSSE